MRKIKFRGLRKDGKGWVYGMPTYDFKYVFNQECFDSPDSYEVIPETVGQYTGLKDKKEEEIYEGDILEYNSLKNFTQQSHYDIPPEIDTYILVKRKKEVIFKNGIFTTEDADRPEDNDGLGLLSHLGIDIRYPLEYILTLVGDVDDDKCDINGNDINDSIYGIEVIGNIHENKDLI